VAAFLPGIASFWTQIAIDMNRLTGAVSDRRQDEILGTFEKKRKHLAAGLYIAVTTEGSDG
jgi:hypothetical protein